MIIPCMNCTSASESGGSLAFVDGGRVLLGWPGAPGCTTTGAEESRCCVCALKQEKATALVASNKTRQNRADSLAGWTSRSWSLLRLGCGIGAKLNPAY